MSELKALPDAETASSGPGEKKCPSVPPLSTAPCVSEEDLAKLVALTPLTRTLQDIQQSLQELSLRSRAQEDTSMTLVFLQTHHVTKYYLAKLLKISCILIK